MPLVNNYSKQDYIGDNQIWSLTQGSDNAMYFANNSFFIRFDGVKWEKYMLPNKSIIRSVYSFQNKIYSGSYNEFGFWERINGKMIYTSISEKNNFFENNSKSEEIWKIFEIDSKVYFQSFNELFIYDGKNIEKKIFPFQISYCFVIDKSIYVATVKKGIYKVEKNTFKKIESLSMLDDNIIYGIEKHNNQLYFFTQKKGIYIQDKNFKLSVWSHVINDKLKSQIIISSKIFENKMYIGTAFNGFYVIDLISKDYYNINRSNALSNNSVLNFYIDYEKNVWLGLDNGISHIIQNSPYQVFSDYSGQLGTVYSIAKYKTGYLLGSNHGVFKAINNQISLLPNSQGQVWNVYKNENEYIISHNEGTFNYSNESYTKINDLAGGWKVIKDIYSKDFIQANYVGIYKLSNSNLNSFKKLNDKMKPIKNFIQLSPTILIYTDGYRGLFKLELNNDESQKKITNLTKENNIRNDFGVKMLKYKNLELFFINNEWYNLNKINDKLILNTEFNSNFKDIQEIITINDANLLINKKGVLYVVNQHKEKFIWMPIPVEYYKGKIINNETQVYKIDNKYLVNMDDGFLQINTLDYNFYEQNIKIEAYDTTNKLILNNESIPYKEQLKLFIISEYFGSKKATLYYSFDDEKPINIVNGVLDFKNLFSGNHIVKIYKIDKGNYKEVQAYKFTVLNPWYLSIWMKLFYLVFITIIFFLYYKWNKIKYKHKLNLKEEELRHKNEIVRLELEAENKLKLQEYQKHILENQVQIKANELAGKSLSIVKQTELIDSIKTILETELTTNLLKSKINKAIKINSLNKNEWKSFENNLLKSNEDFVKKLSQNYQNLTSKDIKLCIYLKMNLSSKEIAPLMNISYRGVELHRYRLRKKLNIGTSSNLNIFMNNL